MRKGITLLVLVFALASLMGAMAYNKTTVTSGQTLSVVASDQALLALKPGTGVGNKDQTAYIGPNGSLQIDFGKGLGEAGFHGLQPGSTYLWNKLMSIQNKSAETVDVTLDLKGGAAVATVCATLVDGSPAPPNWFNGMVVWDILGGARTFTLGPNCTIDLEFQLDIPNAKGKIGNYGGTMVVNAVAK